MAHDRSAAGHERHRSPFQQKAGGDGDRPLERVAREHQRAGQRTRQPVDVGGAGVTRALRGDVPARAAGHEGGGGEGPEQEAAGDHGGGDHCGDHRAMLWARSGYS